MLTINIIAVVALGVIAFSIYEIVKFHLLADGTFLQRLWVGVRKSAVTALTHIVAIGSSLLLLAGQYGNEAIGEIADLLGVPEIKTGFMSIVPETKTAVVTLVLAVIFYVARRRSQPTTPT